MLNILIGAAIGAVVNVGAYCAIQLWRGQPIKGEAIAAAVVGGVVAGALAGTTFGASLLAGSTTSAASFLAVDGAAAAGSEKIASNALDGKPLGDGVANAAAWGAVTAPVTGIALRGLGTQISSFMAEGSAAGADASAAAAASGGADAASAVAPAAADAAAPAAASSARAAASRLPMTHHFHAPTAHVLGSSIANSMFGSPWVGEAVTTAKNEKANATPVNPNTGLPLDPTSTAPAAPSTSSSSSPSSTSTPSTSTSSSTTPPASTTTSGPTGPVTFARPGAHVTPRPLHLPARPAPVAPTLTISKTHGVAGALGAPVKLGDD